MAAPSQVQPLSAVAAAFDGLVALRALLSAGQTRVVAHDYQELVEMPEVLATGPRKCLTGQGTHWRGPKLTQRLDQQSPRTGCTGIAEQKGVAAVRTTVMGR